MQEAMEKQGPTARPDLAVDQTIIQKRVEKQEQMSFARPPRWFQVAITVALVTKSGYRLTRGENW